jgi:hypothetical protein
MASNMLEKQPKKKVQNALFAQTVVKNVEEDKEKIEVIEQDAQTKETKQPEKNTSVVPEPKQEEKTDIIDVPKEESKQEKPQLPESKEDTKETTEVVVIEAKEYTELEKQYIQRLEDIREQINNPTPINRLNKRSTGVPPATREANASASAMP